MSDVTATISHYARDNWTLQDLREVVSDTAGADGGSRVRLTGEGDSTGSVDVVQVHNA